MTDRSKLRKRAGVSLTQLSRASGISVSRLSLYERGEATLPSHDLATISAILRERLDETPIFQSDAELTQFIESVGA
jgi:transcriptional regulator with XRE-family HTH domain